MKMPTNNMEQFFKKMIPGEPVKQGLSDGDVIREMVERAAHKMPTVTGIEDDAEMIERVKHTMRPKETLGAWYSRTGLSKTQAALMSEAEILAFVLRATANAADEIPEPKRKLIRVRQ